MTLVSLPSPIAWPGLLGHTVGSPALSTVATLDASGEYMAYVFVAREDMVVSHVGFRAGTSTGSPTCEVRIETLDATGLPSGTLWATNTNGTTGTVSSNTNVLQALTASASITKGQAFSVMVKYATGTSQIIQQVNNAASPLGSSLPYQVVNAGTPTKGNMGGAVSTFVLGSSSTTFYQVPGAYPFTGTNTSAFNNTNGARRGLRFTIPMNCRAIGMRWWNSSSVGDYNAVLFSDAGSELSSSSTAFDGDITAASANTPCTVYFDNTVTLTAGTTYRLVIEPTSATNATLLAITLPSADHRSATPLGLIGHYTTFASAAWDDTATSSVPYMDLLIDQVDNGAGTGGVTGVIGG